MAYLNAVLRPGIEVVLDLVDFDRLLEGCDLVITGEGRIDAQSLSGKVPVGVARRARRRGVPAAAIVGDVGNGAEAVYGEGISAVFSINRVAVPFSQAKLRSEADYRSTLEDLLRFARAMGL